jgi:hypothetical protein
MASTEHRCVIVSEDNTPTRLRQETRIQHQRARRHRLRRALAAGTLSRDLYVDFLIQRFLIHAALEKQARRLVRESPPARRILEHQREALADLRADLAFLGVDWQAAQPAPATAELLRSIEHTARINPIALLGVCYALHATALASSADPRKSGGAYGLKRGPGTLYTHGGWCDRLLGPCALELANGASDVSRLQTHALVAAARMTYVLLAKLEDERFGGGAPG